jgi:F-type H+-transporting ATPase subunit gamma
MKGLLVALALAAPVSAFQKAPATAPARTVVYGKGGELRDRIQTVGNTQKITEAMRLVAAAKVRRAQEAVLQTRPFSETLQSVFMGLIDQLGKEPIDLPILETREVKKVTLLAISGDRGLCGSYNTYIIKKTEARKKELEAQGIEVEIVPVGTKVAGYFRRRGTVFPAEFSCPQVPGAEFASDVSRQMLEKFLDGETDKVELIYTQFVSLIASAPKLKTLLPLSATGIETEGDEMFELTTKEGDLVVETTGLEPAEAKVFPKDTIFEQDPLAILNGILPLYLDGQILRSLQESVASELASRMQSMQSASDNAKDLKKTLTSTYNRIRQAGVTQEILEIVAGATAAAG